MICGKPFRILLIESLFPEGKLNPPNRKTLPGGSIFD